MPSIIFPMASGLPVTIPLPMDMYQLLARLIILQQRYPQFFLVQVGLRYAGGAYHMVLRVRITMPSDNALINPVHRPQAQGRG